MRFLLVLGIYLVSVGLIHLKVNEEVTPTCSKNDIKCSVTWTLEKEETMMLYGPSKYIRVTRSGCCPTVSDDGLPI